MRGVDTCTDAYTKATRLCYTYMHSMLRSLTWNQKKGQSQFAADGTASRDPSHLLRRVLQSSQLESLLARGDAAETVVLRLPLLPMRTIKHPLQRQASRLSVLPALARSIFEHRQLAQSPVRRLTWRWDTHASDGIKTRCCGGRTARPVLVTDITEWPVEQPARFFYCVTAETDCL